MLLLPSGFQASEVEEDYPYCDVSYRINKFGRVKNIRVTGCAPEKTRKKYRKWTKEIVPGFRFDPKTINGIKVESKNERARIIYDSQFENGFLIKIYPPKNLIAEPMVIEQANEN